MEKFALLNLLKALETLSPPDKTQKNGEAAAPAPTPPADMPEQKPSAEQVTPRPAEPDFNAMANILSRHEQIANRLRNKK